VSSSSERIFEDAVATGRRNAVTIEMARRHCLNMRFVEFGGQGLAEAQTGLPINMRRVECPVAHGGASSNLEWIATDFFRDHCVGCGSRRPTGEVPNLATVVEERDAEAARAAAEQELETLRLHTQWVERAERRRGLVAVSDPAMAGALADIAVLDTEPGMDRDQEACAKALARLIALAQQAPAMFTRDVVDLAGSLAEYHGVTVLFTPLRHLARVRVEFTRTVLDAALAVLRQRVAVEAGRCVADMPDGLAGEDFDADIVRSLVYLAEPVSDRFMGRHRDGVGDASGLRAAAAKAPGLVVKVVREMLPSPKPPVSLVVPAGSRQTAGVAGGDAGRGAASAAVRALAHTHPGVAEQLIAPLVLNLGVDADGAHDREPLGHAQAALASCVLWGVGDVPGQLEAAGRSAGSELRSRLFGVFQQTQRLIDPRDPWPVPGDPRPGNEQRRTIFTLLMSVCLARAGGDWGDECRFDAANMVESLAGIEPAWAAGDLTGVLGTVVTVIEKESGQASTTAGSVLTSTDSTLPQLLAMEQMGRQHTIATTVRDLLKAVETIAGTDPAGVCEAITDVITAERDAERGPDVVRKLLPVLGGIGRRHGDQPGLLLRILPVLHTYILDADVLLRSAALQAWSEIGQDHPLPSSIADLLPALLTDLHAGVVHAVMDAARRLEWSDEDRVELLTHAVKVCQVLDARQHTATVKKAIEAAWKLSDGNERLRAFVEPLILDNAGGLDSYDLRDVLERDWLPATRTSTPMAALRLRQARDPYINDRFNVGDDAQLRALLECGPALAGLPVEDLTAAAVELGPYRVLGAAEFTEVAWRGARPDDARTILQAFTARIPNEPGYALHHSLLAVLTAAADYDVAAAVGDGQDQAQALLDAAAGLEGRLSAITDADDAGVLLVRQARLRVTIRLLLTGRTLPSGAGLGEPIVDRDPAAALRARADRLTTVAAELNAVSQQATATGAYLRHFADLCGIAAQILRLDAAELDADITTITALTRACRRRAALLHDQLAERFDPLDPLAAPLVSAVQQIQSIGQGGKAVDLSTLPAACARLLLPVPVTRGPVRIRRASNPTAQPDHEVEEEDGQYVAVVLASVDGHTITGPQVLRKGTVYELGLQIRTGDWPAWADRLDAELLSHLSVSEAETPVYSWPRPAAHEQDAPLSGNGTLILRFDLPAGRPAPPFRVALRWRGTRDGEPASQIVDVAGHREIRLRPFDASRDYLTSYPVVDERLLALYEQLQAAGYNEDHLQAFCRLFTAICRTGLTITWNKQYKRGTRVTERKFHDDLYAALQAEPELAGRLERGTPLALGFLDVRHDAITAELKVERTSAVTPERAHKYMGQPTQYASADGARLSILCILDMSPKKSPVGTPENYLFTLTPALHGLTNPEAPSLVAVIIVNSNLPVPSAWSRRKTAAQPQTP
jgi:hypothetical protein